MKASECMGEIISTMFRPCASRVSEGSTPCRLYATHQ